MTGRKKTISTISVVVLAAAVLLAAAFWVKSPLAAPAEDVIVAEINGDAISSAELAHFAKLHRASVIEAYLSESGAALDDGFWKRDVRGTTPMKSLRDQAFREALLMKIELQLARELGLVNDVSFASLLVEMEKENVRREAAVSKGEPIYGPASFDASSFIDFYRGKLAASVKEVWAERSLKLGEQELKTFYEGIKTSLMPMEGSLTYETIAVAYRHDGEESETLRAYALRVAETIREQLAAGEHTVEDKQLPTGLSVIHSGELELNEETASRLYRSENALYEALRASTADQPVPSVVDDRAAGRYIVAHVTGLQPDEPPVYEEVRDIVRKLYVEREYEEYVQAQADAAIVLLLPEYDQDIAGVQ
ncbi:hypothetical protein ACX1C1_03590 [Paenibacillus sp. strain BS8-2]